jgi:hypothetical protein
MEDAVMAESAPNKKTVYMTPSRGQSLEWWRDRWRRHCSLGMTRPFWTLMTKYSQCDVIHYAPFGTGEAYDGVGLCWQTPGLASGINGMVSDPEGMRLMIEDEKEVFGVYVGDIAAITVETVLKEGYGAVYKLLLRLYRESDAFESKLDAFGEALLANPELGPLIRRLSVAWVEPDEYTKNSNLGFHGLVEISVDNLDVAQAMLESPQFKAVAEPFAEAIRPDWRVIVTRENLFWDEAKGIDERKRINLEYPPVTF